jgi:hypothetical protein
MKKRKTIWRLWAKAIGEKASRCDRESDTIAWIRTFIFISYLVTNCFIVAGVIRHWNDDHDSNTVQTSRNYQGYLAKSLQTPETGRKAY